MCGLVGIVCNSSYSKEELVGIVSRMHTPIKHRGPDSSGIWVDEKSNIGLGHRRLSILDLSDQGAQPMHSSLDRFVISYNGEIYNFEELKKELENTELRKWKGKSDTEVILASIECWGLERAISKFIGMFAFALWDKQEQLLHLVRDRMGIKPMYWAVQNGNVIFASELKSFQGCDSWNAEIDINSLALFMKYKYVPYPNTIFKNTYQLEPATILTIDKNENIKKTKYWDLKAVANSGINDANNGACLTEDDIVELINDAVKCRLVSDVPIGAFLSGGIDSSAVVALIQNNCSTPVNTFSIGFSIDSYDESVYAREVAQHLGTNHTEFMLEPKDAIDVIQELPKIYDEPFSDSSQIPTYLVSKLTSKNVKVALSGDGGDEVFGGYNRYLYGDKYFDRLNSMPGWLQKKSIDLIHGLSKEKWNEIFGFLPKKIRHSQGGDKLYKLADVIGQNRTEMYHELISDWQFDEGLVDSNTNFQDIDLYCPSFLGEKHSVEYMQLMDQIYYLPNDILTKVDRASMANSLEVRVPLLDHRLVEEMWKLPRRYKINNGVGKIILRKILGKYVSSVNFNRAKTGFSLPISDWLRGPLKDWAESLLNKNTIMSQGLLNHDVITKKWNEHQACDNNWHEHIWSVLMFNAWYEHWIEKK